MQYIFILQIYPNKVWQTWKSDQLTQIIEQTIPQIGSTSFEMNHFHGGSALKRLRSNEFPSNLSQVDGFHGFYIIIYHLLSFQRMLTIVSL